MDGGSKRPYTIRGTGRFASSRFARLGGKQANPGHAAAASLARAARAACTVATDQARSTGRSAAAGLPPGFRTSDAPGVVFSWPEPATVSTVVYYADTTWGFQAFKDTCSASTRCGSASPTRASTSG